MTIDVEDQKRAIMMAEQAVAKMNSTMRFKMSDEIKRQLTNALLASGAQEDFLFRHNPVRYSPPWWSPSGALARLVMLFQALISRFGKIKLARRFDSVDAAQAVVRRRGGVALAGAMLAALICGVIEFGLPFELALQMARDKVRPVQASGDIVVVAQDEKSQKLLGRWPWPRQYDAALADKLREMGATKILFHDAFAYRTDPVNDAAFAAALDRGHGKIWLAAMMHHNRDTGTEVDALPMPLLRGRSQLAHTYVWLDAFGYAKAMNVKEKIGGVDVHASATILAGRDPGVPSFRLDTAIQHKSIPTVSAVDILTGKVDRQAIAGKAVMISATTFSANNEQPILGQSPSRIPTVYTRVIAAETIKNGVARELGWWPPLLAAAAIGLVCVLQRSRRRRAIALGGGTVAVLVLMLVADRIGWHFEMMPGLFALMFLGARDAVRGTAIALETSHHVSGLPNFGELAHIKDGEASHVIALRVEKYDRIVETLPLEEQRTVIHAIAARINIMCPDAVVHQGPGGEFVVLVGPESPCDTTYVAAHLKALFEQTVPGLYGLHDISVGVGVCSSLDISLDARVAVATHSASLAVFVTLHAVS